MLVLKQWDRVAGKGHSAAMLSYKNMAEKEAKLMDRRDGRRTTALQLMVTYPMY